MFWQEEKCFICDPRRSSSIILLPEECDGFFAGFFVWHGPALQGGRCGRLCRSMYSDKSDPQPSFSNPTPRDFYEDGRVVWRYFTRKLIVLPHSSAPTSAIGFRGREYFTRNRNRIFCWAMKIRFFVAYPKTLFVICSIDICGGHFIEIVSRDKNC